MRVIVKMGLQHDLPQAEQKDGRRRIVLKVMKGLGTFLHGHVTRQSPVLKAMLGKFLLKILEGRRELREHQALG